MQALALIFSCLPLTQKTVKILLAFLFCSVAFNRSSAQEVVILDRNMQLFTSINNEPVAFASNSYDVFLNKATGEFETVIPIDNLYLAITNSELRVTGENRGKFMTLRGVLPVSDVLDNNSTVFNLKIEVIVNFNGIDYQTFLTFSILRMQPNGFSVMANGTFPHSVFEIKNLSNAKDELGLQMSFTGY